MCNLFAHVIPINMLCFFMCFLFFRWLCGGSQWIQRVTPHRLSSSSSTIHLLLMTSCGTQSREILFPPAKFTTDWVVKLLPCTTTTTTTTDAIYTLISEVGWFRMHVAGEALFQPFICPLPFSMPLASCISCPLPLLSTSSFASQKIETGWWEYLLHSSWVVSCWGISKTVTIITIVFVK